MTKLKLLIVALVVWVVFVLWVPTGHWETETLPEEDTTVSTWDVVSSTWDEQIIYTWEMTKENLINRVDALVGNYSISTAIVEECTTQVPNNYKKCIEDVIGVSNAESSIFKKWMYPTNNGFGLMYKWKKRKFSSVEDWIKVRVSLYVKNNWETRTTWADWLKGNYCTSECSGWKKNYSSAIKKLSLED